MSESIALKYIIVIPARYRSSRLPGKPLVDLCGVPMIIRTYQQCLKVVSKDKVFVATDDERIVRICKARGVNVIMTSDECLTGTDRVAEVASLIPADVYINVQGDEPLFNPLDLDGLIKASIQNPDKVINGYCKIYDENLFRSSSIPKVVMRPNGDLLYMSRAAIPSNKENKFESAYRQVCAYAFPQNALEEFAKCKSKMPLELIEDIEILRFLELGWNVQMIEMSDDSISVDNPDDVIRVEYEISRRKIL